jgi:hypothetical protein
MARARYHERCGETHRPGQCKMEAAEQSGSGPADQPKRRFKRGDVIPVMQNAAKKDVDDWKKRHNAPFPGDEKIGHWDSVEDPPGSGLYTLTFVIDK